MPSLVYRSDEEGTSPLLLPTSFIGDQCTGVQELVIGNTLTTSCIVSFLVFNKSECEENEFLSAHELLQTFITSNNTSNVQLVSKFPLLPVQWDNETCRNVINEVSLTIKTNDTVIIEAEVESIVYNSLTAKNYSTMMQIFHINFENILMVSKNKTDEGYKSGDEIYVMISNERLPFTLPSLGECAVSHRQQTIKFMVSTTTGSRKIPLNYHNTTFRVMNCQDAQGKIMHFYTEYEPISIDRYPKEEQNKATVHRKNNTWKNPVDSSCSISTTVSIEILYSKQGTLQDSRNMIVHAFYEYSADEIVISPNMSLPITFSVHFTDITTPALPRFASLPRIDLRLPNDFFYPFVSSKTVNNLNWQSLSALMLYTVFT
uniref:DUF1619 domain-containing protein n=1 Tax=Heterorhabditis bacteriophora TaxID=37862 RepID=A0A1I7XDA1_HETBA